MNGEKKGNFFWSPPLLIKKLEMSEWYCAEHKDLFVFFSSWDELKNKIDTLDYDNHKMRLLDFGIKHEKKMLAKWEMFF